MTEKIPTGMVALGDWLGCCRWLVVLFICSVVSDCLQPHGLQHARLLCPSPSPRVCTNSCLLSRWCHPTISSSVTPLSSCPQSFPASWSFQMSQLFASGSQSTGASASASVHPMNILGWFPLGLTGLISLQSKELARVLSSTTMQKASILWCLAFFKAHLSHQCMATRKTTVVLQSPSRVDSLEPQGLQHTRPPHPSPSPGFCPSSCPLHQWCHPVISSSDALFSFCLQSFPALGTYLMSWQFVSDDQNTGASASVLPMSIQGWFPLGLTVWSPCYPRYSQEPCPAPQFK